MRHFSKYFLFSLLAFFCLLISGVIFFAANYYCQFSKSSDLDHSEIKNLLLDAQLNTAREFNFLILGLDQREANNALLTDTIMIGFWRPEQDKATIISLPRDLWLEKLKTKINALYYYSQEQNPNEKMVFMFEEIEEILALEIDYYLVVDFESMAQLVDLLLGVEIEVERPFDDYYFPIDDGTNGLTHLRFEAGRQTMDGKRVLEYVRSRKSDDPEEGTDEARVKRQQKAFMAIFSKFSNLQFLLTNPRSLGSLYRYWQDNIDTDIPTSLLINAGGTYVRQKMAFEFLSLPEEFLVNPPISKYGLWVWEPKDGSWEEIREWARGKISNY